MLYDVLSLTRGPHCSGFSDRAFYTIYAHSPDGDTAAALAEFAKPVVLFHIIIPSLLGRPVCLTAAVSIIV